MIPKTEARAFFLRQGKFSRRRYRLTALIAITGVGGALRFLWLDSVPPSLFIDEVWSSFGPHVFFLSPNPLDWPLPALVAQLATGQLVTYELAGSSAFWTRFSTALVGTAAIPLTYLLVREFTDTRLAMLSGLGMALAPWALHLSRYAVPGMASVVWFILVLLSVRSALRSRSAVWIASSVVATIGLLSTHATMKFFLPLFALGFFLIWRKEVSRVLLDRPLPVAAGLLLIGLFMVAQLSYIFAGENQASSIQASLLSYLVFQGERPFLDELVGILERYFAHWSPDFLFLTGDPNAKYSTGLGGELGILGPFVYVGLAALWRRRDSRSAQTLLLWAVLWPLPSALVVPDNPNVVRSAVGLPILILLSVGGLVVSLRWLGRKVLPVRWLRSETGMSAAFLLTAGSILTVAIYFTVWPSRPGIAAAFDYGYEEAALILRTLPPEPVVVSDRWRAEDLLAFYGISDRKIASFPPGLPIHFDVFRDQPGYLVTSRPGDIDRLDGFGYELDVLEAIRSPLGEPRLWVAHAGPDPRYELADLRQLNWSAKGGSIDWDPESGNVALRVSSPNELGGTYLVWDFPMYGQMRMSATIPEAPSGSADLLFGFSSYSNPTRGAPDGVSPFIAVYYRIHSTENGEWVVTAQDHSIDDREVTQVVSSGLGPLTLRIAYDYLDGFRARFQSAESGGWIDELTIHNYVKQPLYPFVGVVGKGGARGELLVRAIES